MRNLPKTIQHQRDLAAWHRIVGAHLPCSWEAYRAEVSSLLGIRPSLLDAMARCGSFSFVGGVTFLGVL